MNKVPFLYPVEDKGVFSLKQLPNNFIWSELENSFKKNKIKRPILFTGPEAHIEIPFFVTCLKKNIPASIGDVYNLKWTIESILLLKHDTLVSTQEFAEPMLRYFYKNEMILPFRLLFLMEDTNALQNMPNIKKYILDESNVKYSLNPLVKIA